MMKKGKGFKPCSSCKTKAMCKAKGRCMGGMKKSKSTKAKKAY